MSTVIGEISEDGKGARRARPTMSMEISFSENFRAATMHL